MQQSQSVKANASTLSSPTNQNSFKNNKTQPTQKSKKSRQSRYNCSTPVATPLRGFRLVVCGVIWVVGDVRQMSDMRQTNV